MMALKKTGLYSRGQKLFERVTGLASLLGYWRAWLLVLRIKLQPQALYTISYAGKPLCFRREDEQAINEVLVRKEYDFLRTELTEVERPLVLDAGAHIGTFARWVLAVNPSARILSVEPDPETFALLERNRQLSGSPMWQVQQVAASAHDGEMLRFSSQGPPMSHRLYERGEIEVLSVSLPTLLATLGGQDGRVDIVKVDIEGAEKDFLIAAPEALQPIRMLVVELHPQLIETGGLSNFLEDTFDRTQKVTQRTSDKPILICRRADIPPPGGIADKIAKDATR